MSTGRLLETQLRSYEQAWQQDHAEAMRCFDFEERLSVGLALFGAGQWLFQHWRQSVSRGEADLRPEDENNLKAFFTVWLEVCQSVEPRLARYEDRFGTVAGAAKLRETRSLAERILAGWTAPVKQKAPGLLVDELTAAEAERLDALINSGAGRLKIRPREL